MSQLITVLIPAGQALTITANATSAGSYWLLGNPGDAPGAVTTLAAGASAVVGPFQAPKNYELQSDNGVMSAVLAIVGNYNAATDQSNEAATYQPILSGATLTAVTVAVGDKVLVQDLSDASKLKSVTAQSIADLTIGGTAAATLQANIDLKAPIDGPQFTSGVTLLSGANLALDNGGALVLGAPTGSSKGDLVFIGVDNAAAYDVVVQNAAHGQSSTYSIPDTGLSTDAFVMAAANNTVLATKQAVINVTNVGVANTGTTAVEHGDGYNNTTILTVATTLPSITGGEAQAVGKLLYTLPAGAEVVAIAYMSVGVTQSDGNINADTPDVGLGSSVATGSIATLDDDATFEDLITGQTAANCTGTATVKTIANQVFVSEAAGSKAINFNAAATWAADGDAAALIAGTVVLHWKFVH